VSPGARPAVAKITVAKQPAMRPGQPRPNLAAVAARPTQSMGKGKAQTNNNGDGAEDWEVEISVPATQFERWSGKGKGASVIKGQGPKGASKNKVQGPKGAGKNQAKGPKGTGKNQAEGPKGAGKNQAAATANSPASSATSFELAKKANDMAKKALLKMPEKSREGKLPQLRNLFLKELRLQEKNAAQDKSGNEATSMGIAAKSKFAIAAKLRQTALNKSKVKDDGHQFSSKKRNGTDASNDDERPPKKTDRKHRGADDGTSNIKATDPEGRKYDFDTIVVNMANVGATFSKKVLKKEKHLFDWEGVRRCVRFLKCDRKLKVIGVLNENFRGPDNNKFPQVTMPADIERMCASVEETPRLTGKCHSSADDEMTIKCAYRRNSRFLDNDNYRDWCQQLRDEKIRTWLTKCQDLLQMRYFFDKGLGTFDVLEGNIPACMLAQGKTDVDKRELWTAKRS